VHFRDWQAHHNAKNGVLPRFRPLGARESPKTLMFSVREAATGPGTQGGAIHVESGFNIFGCILGTRKPITVLKMGCLLVLDPAAREEALKH